MALQKTGWSFSIITKRSALILSATLCFQASGQLSPLENTLMAYFDGIPALQSPDSIIHFTSLYPSKYKVIEDRDSRNAIERLDISSYHYGADTTRTDFVFATGIPLFKHDTVQQASVFGVSINKRNTFRARKEYRRISREISGYFKKTTTEREWKPLMGGRSKTKSFYLAKTDKVPFLQVYWSNGSCLQGPYCSIDIIK